ncbi:MAG: hypothetical protein AB9866_29840 [Syntrophobacteraceae bacterium]
MRQKNCRCTRGELHGPYWYAYYRVNGRLRCEYLGKNLPGPLSLENRARKACKNAEAEHERAAKIVAEVKDTLKKLVRFNGYAEAVGAAMNELPGTNGGFNNKDRPK